ncbi:peroxiredoxin [Sedimenticola selenatireducens]|uniref:TlpA family protein disulfide reductase n=1 Tax=Sedimenticola selenatireducens TaxID=191960 RepID=A0A2N6CUB6_9GAMM|nr:TlpA disulfide reductase family protein [Sedimenticola selenatireducens]PLX60756.1 MAG: TlpA family protein disulfide reductase [Sedimenticola selenatireducens]
MNALKVFFTLLLGLLLTAGSASAARLLTPVDPPTEAPAFTLQDTGGNRISLADYRGKVLVVNFWATWCPPCRREMPSLNRAAAWLKKYDVALIAINSGERADKVEKFLQEQPLDFPVLLDPDSTVSTQWKATRLPITYVVDPQGRLVYRALGSREWDAPELLVPIRGLGLPR